VRRRGREPPPPEPGPRPPLGTHRYAALRHGVVHAEGLQTALATRPLADGLAAYAVDVAVVVRCDAETSPDRGCYYHPSCHSAGQLIVAGWAYSSLAQLGPDRTSWTAPLDA
jgi:hypothetical protein